MLTWMWNNKNSCLSLVGVQNSTATLEKFLTKLNICLPYDLSITFLSIYLNELKTMHTHKSSHELLRSYIPNCQNLKAIKVTFSR